MTAVASSSSLTHCGSTQRILISGDNRLCQNNRQTSQSVCALSPSLPSTLPPRSSSIPPPFLSLSSPLPSSLRLSLPPPSTPHAPYPLNVPVRVILRAVLHGTCIMEFACLVWRMARRSCSGMSTMTALLRDVYVRRDTPTCSPLLIDCVPAFTHE